MTVALRVLRRLGVFVASLLVASVLIFLVCAALPGDVAQVMLGANADPRAVEAMRERLGLNRPLPVRYLEWVGGMLTGDFGTSLLSRRPVVDQIAAKLGVTLWLVGLAMLVAILLAVPIGMFAAVRRRHIDGYAASALSQVGLAIPAFWAGIMATYLFAVKLRWLPPNGYVPLTQDPGRWASHLVLPVLALAVVQASVLVRYVRSAIIEVLSEDYYRTARAIGWRQMPALFRHGLRNASLSVVTVLGLQLATLLVGAIVIESVFALPGLGSLLLLAVSQRDLVLVQGTVMLLVFAVLVINALVDLSYLVLDPRLRGNR
ncbi:ABC transporter permease [Naumannella sp. ID2617S]|uniref:ABC transporter permease n=1 Tax=Enemella dayhoffiae TaxID=2016507 RepID=A0A255GUI2_9ACTN|nr:ABC transporter permease [Enemella dayhoffiae]NNG18881.1 ABC transporter permease [Naumannella sp. ID2617S]OYO19359.1 ABC transporter permease [Enemella dayhoffiae]